VIDDRREVGPEQLAPAGVRRALVADPLPELPEVARHPHVARDARPDGGIGEQLTAELDVRGVVTATAGGLHDEQLEQRLDPLAPGRDRRRAGGERLGCVGRRC
jgi:hypothetical protein